MSALTFFSISDEDKKFYRYLVEANKKCEWLWNMYFKLIMGGYFVGTLSLCAVLIIVCRIKDGEFNTQLWYLPFRTM